MEGLCYLITTKLKEQEKWVKEALQDLRNIGGMELGIFESNEGKIVRRRKLVQYRKNRSLEDFWGLGSCIQSILGSIF